MPGFRNRKAKKALDSSYTLAVALFALGQARMIFVMMEEYRNRGTPDSCRTGGFPAMPRSNHSRIPELKVGGLV
jgi:hypothetical protein